MRGFTILLLMATAVMAQPETIDLPLNQPEVLTWSDGNALMLRWDEVVTDSRCPTDAV